MVFQLDDELWFPDPHLADEDGCLAVGGDLSIDSEFTKGTRFVLNISA